MELTDWSEVKPIIIDTICDYFTKNLELFDKKPEAEVKNKNYNILKFFNRTQR
jgi:hypothetical protein